MATPPRDQVEFVQRRKYRPLADWRWLESLGARRTYPFACQTMQLGRRLLSVEVLLYLSARDGVSDR